MVRGLLLVAAFFGVSWLYETWKKKVQEKGGAGAKIARVSDIIGRGIGVGLSGLQWIFVKSFGVVSVLVAVLLLGECGQQGRGYDLRRVPEDVERREGGGD